MTRHFLRDDDLSPAELVEVLDLADAMKADRFGFQPLAGPRSVAVIFDKPSTRTRVSFSVGIAELGGYPLVIDSQSSQLGRGESIEDTARVLDRQVAAIVWRTFGQDRIEAMAAASSVPVVNALTDEFHPCQLLADLQTVREHKGRLAGLTLTYLGDAANNMAHSYLLAGAAAGHARAGLRPGRLPARPGRAAPTAERIAAGTGGSVSAGTDPKRGGRRRRRAGHRHLGVDGPERRGASAPAVTGAVRHRRRSCSRSAAPDAIVLHCLPAYRGKEISAEVIDGPQSVVFDEAENRLHAQKALLDLAAGAQLMAAITHSPRTTCTSCTSKAARHARIVADPGRAAGPLAGRAGRGCCTTAGCTSPRPRCRATSTSWAR